MKKITILALIALMLTTNTMASEMLAEQNATTISAKTASAVMNDPEVKTVVLDENTTVVTDGVTAKVIEEKKDEKGILYYVIVTIFLPVTILIALILAPVYLIKGHKLDPKGETTEAKRAAREALEKEKEKEIQ